MSRIVLAPMEGLADDVLRGVLTGAGGYDWCVTEFVRVTDTVLPHRCYTRLSPELARGARTKAGTPVRIQLLGNDPDMLAANAAHLARLNPFGIDLNFGCPTPLVVRHRGGAALLDYGWMALSTSAPLGFPATIEGWCYEHSGAGITTPALPDLIFAHGFES